MAMSPFSYFDTVALLLFISPAKTSMVIFFILRYKRIRLPTCTLISFINPHHLLFRLPIIPVFFLSVAIQQYAAVDLLRQIFVRSSQTRCGIRGFPPLAKFPLNR